MYSDIQTFGEFLNSLLQKRNMSIKEFASIIHVKSRNSIQRLLKDESSIDLIVIFKDKLLQNQQLKLTIDEIVSMNQSIEVNRYGKETIYSRRLLINLCKCNLMTDTYFLPCDNDASPDIPRTLFQLLDQYKQYEQIHILIFDATIPEFTDAIVNIVQTATTPSITIEHILHVNQNPAVNARMFTAIYKLVNYKYYNAYYTYENPKEWNSPSSVLSNAVIIHKVNKAGQHHVDLIMINHNTQYHLLYNNPGAALYQFYQEHFQIQKEKYHCVRRFYHNDDPMDKLLNLCEFFLQLERSSTQYVIKQNMCYQMIPFDVLHEMLKDSNYLGLTEDHPKIQQLIQIFSDRLKLYFNVRKRKVHMFTKRGLWDFVKTHTLSDQYYQFRDFTTEEVKITLNFMLSQLKSNPYFKLYLLKDEYKISNIEYFYYENQAVYLFDSCSGYHEDLDEGFITAEPFLKIIDDFIKNELLPNYTFPEEDTIPFLEQLIASIE